MTTVLDAEQRMFTEGLSELVLVVRDVRAASRFYREIVGLVPMTEATDEWAWFWTGRPEASPRLALRKGALLFEEHSPHPPGQRWGHVHYAFEVPRPRLNQALRRLRERDVVLHGPRRFEWMQADAWYFYDPDGNLLEFWSPDPR
jgi:catechol-2,3-dioxygenase